LILVDTSVWIDHLRGSIAARALGELLEAGEVAVHAFVRGELALGELGRLRARVLADLAALPRASLVSDDEVLHMVDARRLRGTGIGWVDAHIAASALQDGARLWTFDRPLQRVAMQLRVAWRT